MKTYLLPILLILALCQSSCTTPEGQALSRVAIAGGIGYLEGGKVGAIAGAAAEARRFTSAKNPPAQPITP